MLAEEDDTIALLPCLGQLLESQCERCMNGFQCVHEVLPAHMVCLQLVVTVWSRGRASQTRFQDVAKNYIKILAKFI